MLKNLLLSFISFTLFACSGGSGGSGGATTYKYQVSGTSSLSLISFEEEEVLYISDDVGPLSSSFILKWNEDGAGNITGIYTNQATGETLSITGVSNGSGREITATRSSAIGGILSFKIVIAQTGDLSGSVNATLKKYDINSAQVGSDESVTVTAETTGGTGGGGSQSISCSGSVSGNLTTTPYMKGCRLLKKTGGDCSFIPQQSQFKIGIDGDGGITILDHNGNFHTGHLPSAPTIGGGGMDKSWAEFYTPSDATSGNYAISVTAYFKPSTGAVHSDGFIIRFASGPANNYCYFNYVSDLTP